MNVVDLYTIQILERSKVALPPTRAHSDRIAALMAETEENLTDLLPAGYSARIRKWDDPNPDEGADDE